MLDCYEIREEKKKELNEKIKKYFDNKKDFEYWDFGNNILYKLCEEKSEHTEKDVIYAKIWLIGRSYAAAIDRRKKYNDIATDRFYKKIVASAIKKNSHKLDTKIPELNKCKCLDEENIKKALSLHKDLTDVFNDLTNLDMRSLASKYLHFHCPKMFFIYDDIAYKRIMDFVKKKRGKNPNKKGVDSQYVDFYYRSLRLVNYIREVTQNEYDIIPRDLDNILYKEHIRR